MQDAVSGKTFINTFYPLCFHQFLVDSFDISALQTLIALQIKDPVIIMLEGKDVGKHPSTQERGVNLRSSTKKQGVDITKYLLLCTLMPSNITFQH